MEIFERCRIWIAKQTGAKSGIVTLSSIILFLSVHNSVIGRTPVYTLLGNTTELTCASSTQDDTYIWTDQSVTPNVNIYLVSDDGDQEQTGSAQNNPKYANFGIDNNYPDFVNLTIQSVQIEDGSDYQCSLLNVGADSVTYTVHIEALPISVNMSCTRTPPDDCPQSVGASSQFTCSCDVVGAYPDTLTLIWSNIEGDPATDTPANSTLRPGAYDYTATATFIPTENRKTATCTIGGYSGSWTVEEDDYTTAPPVCQLETVCNGTNTGVALTCNCDSALPTDGLIYSFFQDNEMIHSGDTNSYEMSIESDVKYVFGCRQCNGVNYGQESYSSLNVICTDGTTALPTTTVTTEITPTTPVPTATGTSTMTTMFTTTAPPETSSTDDGIDGKGEKAPIGLIIGLSCVGLIVICAGGGVAVYCIKRDGKGCSSNSHDETSIDLESKETAVSKETSEAEYAVPNKKKKSNKPDGNGAGPENDPPTYAAVDKPQPTAAPRTSQKGPEPDGMELQYADLDHTGKPATSEIRKPQDEPTEYATVQSVIV